jgi:hypothetical protein
MPKSNQAAHCLYIPWGYHVPRGSQAPRPKSLRRTAPPPKQPHTPTHPNSLPTALPLKATAGRILTNSLPSHLDPLGFIFTSPFHLPTGRLYYPPARVLPVGVLGPHIRTAPLRSVCHAPSTTSLLPAPSPIILSRCSTWVCVNSPCPQFSPMPTRKLSSDRCLNLPTRSWP